MAMRPDRKANAEDDAASWKLVSTTLKEGSSTLQATAFALFTLCAYTLIAANKITDLDLVTEQPISPPIISIEAPLLLASVFLPAMIVFLALAFLMRLDHHQRACERLSQHL